LNLQLQSDDSLFASWPGFGQGFYPAIHALLEQGKKGSNRGWPHPSAALGLASIFVGASFATTSKFIVCFGVWRRDLGRE